MSYPGYTSGPYSTCLRPHEPLFLNDIVLPISPMQGAAAIHRTWLRHQDAQNGSHIRVQMTRFPTLIHTYLNSHGMAFSRQFVIMTSATPPWIVSWATLQSYFQASCASLVWPNPRYSCGSSTDSQVNRVG